MRVRWPLDTDRPLIGWNFDEQQRAGLAFVVKELLLGATRAPLKPGLSSVLTQASSAEALMRGLLSRFGVRESVDFTMYTTHETSNLLLGPRYEVMIEHLPPDKGKRLEVAIHTVTADYYESRARSVKDELEHAFARSGVNLTIHYAPFLLTPVQESVYRLGGRAALHRALLDGVR